MRLSAFIETNRSVDVRMDVFDLNVKITYKPGIFTPELEERIDDLSRKGLMANSIAIEDLPDEEAAQVIAEGTDAQSRVVNYLVEVLSTLIVSWDVTNDDDSPMPVTREVMAKIPYPAQRAIFQAISDDMAPKAKNSRR